MVGRCPGRNLSLGFAPHSDKHPGESNHHRRNCPEASYRYPNQLQHDGHAFLISSEWLS